MVRIKHRIKALVACTSIAAMVIGENHLPAALGEDKQPPETILQWLQSSNAHLGTEAQYLASANAQWTVANARLQDVKRDVAALQTQLNSERDQVIPIVRFHYEHGPSGWLWISMLVNSKDWRSLQTNVDNILEILSLRDRVLTNYGKDLKEANQLADAAQSLVEDLQVVQDNLRAEQAFYAMSQGEVDGEADGGMSAMTRLLQSTWDTALAPAIGDLLQQLDSAVNRLPSALPSQDINVSITGIDVTIPQTVLNQDVHQTPSLKDVQFLFRPNHVFLSAAANGQRVLVMGHLSIDDSGRRANFIIDSVAVDGILVNPGTTSKWFQQYAFFIDVSHISNHVQIQSIQIGEQTLHLRLKPVL